MSDMFRDFMRPMHGMQGMGQNQLMPFRMDVNETDNAYIVHADLPGVRKEDIHVSIEGNQVTIDAEARAPEMGGMQGQGMGGMQGQGMQGQGMQGQGMSGMQGQGMESQGMQGQNVPIQGKGGATSQAAGQGAGMGAGTQTGQQGSQATAGQKSDQMMAGQGGQIMSGQGGQMQRQGMRSLRSERYTGRIYRSFILPDEVDADKAKAKFENGVLTLTLPKMQHAAGRQLNIE
jgi:HSP20 family molecular chaperone IbpA